MAPVHSWFDGRCPGIRKASASDPFIQTFTKYGSVAAIATPLKLITWRRYASPKVISQVSILQNWKRMASFCLSFQSVCPYTTIWKRSAGMAANSACNMGLTFSGNFCRLLCRPSPRARRLYQILNYLSAWYSLPKSGLIRLWHCIITAKYSTKLRLCQ